MSEMQREVPHDYDLENKVLGTLLMKDMGKVKKIFFPDIFHHPKNHIIARVIFSLVQENKPHDLLSVTTMLKENDYLKRVGIDYITELTYSPLLHPIEFYIRILQQYWMKREMLKVLYKNYNKCYNKASDSFEINSVVKNKMEEIASKVLVGINSFTSDIDTSLEIINLEAEGKGMKFITGDKEFDEKAGLRHNSLVMIAAENKAGKTRFMIYLIKQLLKHENAFVYWVTLEDPIDKIIRLLIAEEVGLTEDQMLSDGYVLSKSERKRIIKAHQKIKNLDIFFTHERMYLEDIGRKFKEMSKKDKLNILIVDNLMLVKDRNPKDRKNDAALAFAIDNWGIKMDDERNKIAFIIHHLGEEQMNEKRREEGYRARQEHVLGQDRSKSALRNIMTHIFLVNNPSLHPDLIDDFGDYGNILKDVFVLELAAARNKENAVFRYFKQMDFSNFKLF